MAFASLTIDLNARLAKFETDLGKAAQISQRHAQQMQRAFSRVGSTLAALGAGISFGAAIAGIRNLVDGAAKLDDLAEKTGASVEELSKLEQVVRIGGHQMEVAETAMIRLTKAIHGGDEEAKGAGKALAVLGLNAEEMRKKDTAEALRIVAESLNQYADGAGKTALAVDLFGRSGAQALPLLKDLATEQGIAARVTAEQAAEAEELQKSLGRLGNQIRSAAQAITLGFLPSMIKITSSMAEAARQGGILSAVMAGIKTLFTGDDLHKANVEFTELTEHLLELEKTRDQVSVRRGMEKQLEAVESRIAVVRQKLQALQIFRDQLEGKRDIFGQAVTPSVAVDKPLLDYASTAQKTGKAVQESAARFEDFESRTSQAVANAIHGSDIVKARELAAQIEKLDSLFFDAVLSADIYEAALRKLTGATDNQARAAKDAAEEQARLDRLFNPTNTARTQRIQSDIDFINVMEERGKVTAQVAEEMKQKLLDVSEKSSQTADEMGEFWKQAAHNMQDAMSDFFFDLMQGKFDDLGTKFKTTIDRMVANLLASQ